MVPVSNEAKDDREKRSYDEQSKDDSSVRAGRQVAIDTATVDRMRDEYPECGQCHRTDTAAKAKRHPREL